MRIKIEKIIYEGFGLGRDKNGCPIFVKKAVPGDELEIEIIKDKKSYKEGITKKVIKPSKYRIEPKCPYFNECGGCEHMNISYKNQLRFKEEIFTETMHRQKVNITPEPIIAGSDQEFFYRNSIRFFFLLDKDNNISFARHNFEYNKGFVRVEKCLLQSKTCNEILTKLTQYINQNVEHKSDFWQLKIREGKFTNEFMIEIITASERFPKKEGIVSTIKNIENIASIYHTIAPAKSLKNLRRHLLFGSPIIYEKIGKYKFQISPESFFQTNSLGVHTLYDKIKEFAEIRMGDDILDLFCGTGSIGIYLSTLAKKVVGVEIVPEAIRDAKDNAKINRISNCEFILSDVDKLFKKLEIRNSKLEINDYEIIVLDPPRAGLNKDLIKTICKSNIPKIVYVSCNPATFARDIKIFEEYNYQLIKVQPIDMFPQTHHLECVGIIKKVSKIL